MLSTHQGARTDRLVAVCAHRGVSLALAAAIAVTDHVVHQQQLPFLWRGLMDEPCHLATAMIVLGALARWRGRPPSSRAPRGRQRPSPARHSARRRSLHIARPPW